MNLLEVIERIKDLDPSTTIYASEPWSAHSLAVVAHEPSDGGLPAQARERGLSYFLEVFLACEFLDGWSSEENEGASEIEKCHRLIQYALNDA